MYFFNVACTMPERRTDWLTGRTVFVAENRAERPNQFCAPVSGLPPAESEPCPFCPGQEHTTPPAVHEVLDEQRRWKIRVVPNKYPAVVESAVETGSSESTASPALGVHEVIIESSRHVDRLSSLSVDELRDVLQIYAQRLLHWRVDGRFAYGLVFRNQGPRAGASLAHLHSQFVAMPTVPPTVQGEMRRAEHALAASGRCAYCHLLEQELSSRERIVYDERGYVAFCPFASLQPFETWLMPQQHASAFEHISPEGLQALADALHWLILRIERVVPDAAYNLLVRTAPWQGNSGPWHHWRIELLPRATPLAGFELATGMFINPLAPERAASKLRSV
jgi:UDPglucose--hexose-1-phosphate uridylyltransferase